MHLFGRPSNGHAKYQRYFGRPAQPAVEGHHRRTIHGRIQWLALLLVFIAATAAIYRYLLYPVPILPKKITSHCGWTAFEAHALGCVYDFIPGAWVPKDCYDAELEAEFLALNDWKWYSDEKQHHEISYEDMRANGVTGKYVYQTPQYHDAHCAYTWRKLHRAILGQRKIDSHIGGWEHTVHCSGTMYRNRTPDWPSAPFGQIFTQCIQM